MSTEKAHNILGLVSMLCLFVGAWSAWGLGYGCMLVGSLLLAGVVYARTRKPVEDVTP